MLKRLVLVILFTIALAYIESAVVVYLRVIFHPDGFNFPLPVYNLNPLWRRLILTEIGREAATLVIIVTGGWLFGKNTQQRWAFALVIFSVWDIFYYIWLKVLLDWPANLMDWDILFLIPTTWASPVLYPVLVSLAMFAIAMIILHRSRTNQPVRLCKTEAIVLVTGCAIIVVSFCIGGSHVTQLNYADYFYWPLFSVGYALAVGTCVRMFGRKEGRGGRMTSVLSPP